jgi:hypothetical protein
MWTVLCTLLFVLVLTRTQNAAAESIEALYQAAVLESIIAAPSEIRPLVSLTKDDPLTTWNGKGQVLLLTFHKYPESYVAGRDYVTRYGEVWAFTDKEILKWYKENSSGVRDWELRFKQLIGVPPDKEYTHFSAIWTSPEDVKRPAYEPNAASQVSEISLPRGVNPDFRKWFNGNIVRSYLEGAYPWTKLGYTYDWARKSKTYGLSEFLVRKDATVTVEFTKTIDEFLKWLDEQQPLEGRMFFENTTRGLP